MINIRMVDSYLKHVVYGNKEDILPAGTIFEWKDIPMELLLRIVSLLDDQSVISASGVCNGWREAICMGISNLSLSWCKNGMNNLVISLASKFTKLQVLCLRQNRPQLEDKSVEMIANYCHDLLELDLSKSFKLTDRSLHALAHGCPNLTKLNISGCSSFSDSSLEHLTNFCRNLKHLNLCGCVNAASDRALKAIGNNCSQLQSLNLGWCELVSDVGVTSLANGCSDIRAVDLCGCILITDVSVVALWKGCIHLRSLGLYYCQNITDLAMYTLAERRYRGQPKMRPRMNILPKRAGASRCDEEGLKNLNISQCTALTPNAVQAVCNSFPALHTCPGRHSLIISGCLNLTSVHCACASPLHSIPLPP